MKRKLQVFISSTYLDLKEERQAAVEAILEAGHIPAGMELFAAGDKSQLDTIRRWINDSDVYLLILGGRYGSIDPESDKSYIELEYLHAVDRKMPYFALVLKEATIEAKVKRDGLTFVERDNPAPLKQFKEMVTRKICSFVEDTKDIKLAIYKSLKEITDNNPGLGWVPAKETADSAKVTGELATLAQENSELYRKVASLEGRIRELSTKPNRDAEFERIFNALSSIAVDYNDLKVIPIRILLDNKEMFITGIHNALNAREDMRFLFYHIAPLLKIHGLIEDDRKPKKGYDIQRMSKLGLEFIAWSLEKLSQARQEQPNSPKGSAKSSPSIERATGTKPGDSAADKEVAPQAGLQTTQPQKAPRTLDAKHAPKVPAQTENANVKRRVKLQTNKKLNQ